MTEIEESSNCSSLNSRLIRLLRASSKSLGCNDKLSPLAQLEIDGAAEDSEELDLEIQER